MKIIGVLVLPLVLGACGLSQIIPEELAEVADSVKASDDFTAMYFNGGFAFTEDGILRTLPKGQTDGEVESYSGNGLEYVASQSTDYVVIGGRLNGSRITSISDSYTPVAMRGKAEFSGTATLLDQGEYTYLPMTLIANFGASNPKIRNEGGEMSLYGEISSNGSVYGSVAYGGTEAKMKGGFFGDRKQVGSETFAAGFAGGTMTGIIVVKQ